MIYSIQGGVFSFCVEGAKCEKQSDGKSVCVSFASPSPSPSTTTTTVSPSPSYTPVSIGGQCGGTFISDLCEEYSQCVRIDPTKAVCQDYSESMIQEGGQCAGQGFTGYKSCNYKKGLRCKKVSDKLSTCQVYSAVKHGDKCGGIGYEGPTNCEDGNVCIYENVYSSTCRENSTSYVQVGEPCGPFSSCVEGAKCRKITNGFSLCRSFTSAPPKTSTTISSTATVTAVVSSTPKPVAMGNQCGGKNYTGSTVCEAGNDCVVMDETISICLPPGFPIPPATTYTSTVKSTSTTSSAPTSTPKPVPIGNQCGGNNYSGSTVCEAGNDCVVMDETISICLPPGFPIPPATT
ncbi:hypothetical protein HK098_005137 [Nowakowskiella sp. JEL0407]|nr:hypothetical protein HK098_005137 [Nowakowskiella sp. JEL0407]